MCNNALLNQPFSHLKVPQWVSTIIENILKELAVQNVDAAKNGHPKFKYVGAPERAPVARQPHALCWRRHTRRPSRRRERAADAPRPSLAPA